MIGVFLSDFVKVLDFQGQDLKVQYVVFTETCSPRIIQMHLH